MPEKLRRQKFSVKAQTLLEMPTDNKKTTMLIHNEDIRELIAEIPEGHKHLRAKIVFQDGREFVFQEATIANLVRAYIIVKTHPVKKKLILKGMSLSKRKDGYAEWQLIEEG